MTLTNILKEGDTLVVTKLDRFARSTQDALEIIKDLFNRNIKVHVLNMGVIENTPTGRLIFNIFSAFAEFERDMIVERTQGVNWLQSLIQIFVRVDLENSLKGK